MVYTVYIDVIFAVNFLMDFLVLAILNRLSAYRACLSRLFLGASLGAVWACVMAVFPNLPVFVRAVGTYIAMGSLMAAVAYRLKNFQEVAKAAAGIYLVSVVLGGVQLCLYESIGDRLKPLTEWKGPGGVPIISWVLFTVGSSALAWGLLGEAYRKRRQEGQRLDLCHVVLTCGENQVSAVGLLDTGNRLKEPCTGRPVHVASKMLMKRLCPTVKGVIYVPYCSVGGQGVLPAVQVDEMQVEQEGKKRRIIKALVAISGEPVSPKGEYEILIQKMDEGIETGGTFHDD